VIPQFAEQVRTQIRERMNALADHMAGGGCTDWADYRASVGEVTGLARAERSLLDLVEAFEKGNGDGKR